MIYREVEKNILQITLDEERWYERDGEFYPSITFILDKYPKDIGFQKYLVSLGSWEQGRQVLQNAGERGGKVHAGIEQLLHNLPLTIHDIPTGFAEPFTVEEWLHIESFKNWYMRYKPIVESVEQTVLYSEKGISFGGTIDLICKIDKGMLKKKPEPIGEYFNFIIDWKTSSNIYESYKCQVAAYSVAQGEKRLVGIVRLNTRHKDRYQFWMGDLDDIKRYYQVFKDVYGIWKHEYPDIEPKRILVPEKISLIEGEDDD